SRIVPSKSNTTLNMDTEEQVSSASYSHAALFPHELLDVVGPAAAASGRAAGFPARKRVDPRPCSRRRARAAVYVHDAGVHMGEEAFDRVLVLGEESRRQAVIGAVGQLDGLVERRHLRHEHDGNEQLLLEERAVVTQSVDDGRLDEVS